MGIYNIKVLGNRLIIEGFYKDARNQLKDPAFGVYSVLPKGRVRNRYAGLLSYCGNWMNWAYNNPYQPHADFAPGKPLKVSYIDGSGANSVESLGSMKTIWKNFEKQCLKQGISLSDYAISEIEEMWWSYYYGKYSEKFESAVHKFERYIEEKRALFSESERETENLTTFNCGCNLFSQDGFWKAGCSDYLQYLVRMSARGFMMEIYLFRALCDLSGGQFIESNIQDERRGIDGYIDIDGVKRAICLKPDTFRGGISPIYESCLVFYNKREKNAENLVFTFKTGEEILENL